MTVGLSADDLAREAERFGVADEQVRRDHAISHVLAAISAGCGDKVVFFGGTALSRTHLVHARLSEDIDLIANGPRQERTAGIVSAIEGGIIRTLGRVTWNPPFGIKDVEPAVLETQEGIAIQIQMLDAAGYPEWPTVRRAIEQRYKDAPPATLVVPTAASFAAWKTATWHARRAPRDLYDLWAMATEGMIDAKAAALFAKFGPTGGAPRPFMFAEAPSRAAWEAALAAQTRLRVTAHEALDVVRKAWASALGEVWDVSRARRGGLTDVADQPAHAAHEQSRHRGR